MTFTLTKRYADGACRAALASSENSYVAWYLMASYAYYILDDPILSDDIFDLLCINMIANWDKIDHQHKHLIDIEALRAGTGYHLKDEDFPNVTKGAATHVLRLERMPKEHVKAKPYTGPGRAPTPAEREMFDPKAGQPKTPEVRVRTRTVTIATADMRDDKGGAPSISHTIPEQPVIRVRHRPQPKSE